MRLAVLGPLRVTSEPERRLERPSHRRLLAILLLEPGRPLDADRLIDRFWGDGAPATAKAALQTHVSAIRKRLGAELIRTSPAGYAADLEGHELDLLEFESAADEAREAFGAGGWQDAVAAAGRALDLWAGSPFPELEDDAFARPEIVRLEELRLELVELRASSLLELGRTEATLPELERLSLEHPLRERLWELLMLARARGGRTADALDAYHRLRGILRELGLEPGAALRDLQRRILQEDPALVPPRVRHNLPVRLTSFVGRGTELRELEELLQERRLLTLTGVGGCGKTRLAEELAGRLLGRFPDGCHVVSLAPLADPELVPGEVALALGLDGQPSSARLAELLRQRTALVILDNCEHVLEGAGRTAAALLEAGPAVTVLATSREALGLEGEAVYAVPPLPIPDEAVAEADVAGFAAVELLVDRARLVVRDFGLTAENAAAVAGVCRRLDGLPLAIELVAARLASLSPQLVEERLGEGLDLVAGRGRDTPRHRALEATIAWSYELLEEAERALFARLSVFAAPFAPDAVEAVCAGDGVEAPDVLQLLTRLVEQSLVVPARADPPHYRQLETLRQFAGDRLEEDGDAAERVRRRHRDWFLGLAREAEAHRGHADELDWLERLDAQHDDMRAALSWSQARGEPAPELATALAWYWEERGQHGQAVPRLRTALEQTAPGDDPLREADLRSRLALTLFRSGDEPGALAEAERAHALLDGTGPSRVKVQVLHAYALLLQELVDADHDRAVPIAREGLAAARSIGDRLAELGLMAFVGADLGERVERAWETFRAARAEEDPRTTAAALNQLFIDLWQFGRRDRESGEVAEETVDWLRSGGDRFPWSLRLLGWLGYRFLQSGEWDRAEDAVGRMAAHEPEGYNRIWLHHVRGSLWWMQGRLDRAAAEVRAFDRAGGLQRWYHDLLTLEADVAADRGRLVDVRAAADRYLALEVSELEEAMKAGVLRAVVRAEVDAALATAGRERDEHASRAREAAAAARDVVERFPPTPEYSRQYELPGTSVLLAKAELSRIGRPDPELWRRVAGEAWMAYWRLYARMRLGEALVAAGRGDEGAGELRVAHAEASELGAELVRERLELADETLAPVPAAVRLLRR